MRADFDQLIEKIHRLLELVHQLHQEKIELSNQLMHVKNKNSDLTDRLQLAQRRINNLLDTLPLECDEYQEENGVEEMGSP